MSTASDSSGTDGGRLSYGSRVHALIPPLSLRGQPRKSRNLSRTSSRGFPLLCMSSLNLLMDAASPCTRSGGSPRAEDPAPSDMSWYLTLEHLERDVRTTVLPDDDDTQDEHPWEWLAGLIRAHGVEATAEELRLLPYDVVFSERLRARLGSPRQ
jgi:hypothetical protein